MPLTLISVSDAVGTRQPFGDAVTAVVNGVLFVVIVLEIFRTVLAHLQGGGFQLRPVGFFDRNPALDVPPQPAHCHPL